MKVTRDKKEKEASLKVTNKRNGRVKQKDLLISILANLVWAG
jgi:hypothetical protein